MPDAALKPKPYVCGVTLWRDQMSKKSTETSTGTAPKDLPDPGPGKQDPKELDRQLDRALEDTMEASDPPSTIMPEVHHRDDGDYDTERKERQSS
jgi:hypothetical protein